ncbi:MAG: helix-turn-helix domain-containing protein [Rhodospirillales bacterium]
MSKNTTAPKRIKAVKTVKTVRKAAGAPARKKTAAAAAAAPAPEEKVTFETGSGNVFADLELADADELQRKSGLVIQIAKAVRRRRLTQAQAAKLLNLSQPDVSRLLREDFHRYSVDRLLKMLAALGHDVDIIIRTPRRTRRGGRIAVKAQAA